MNDTTKLRPEAQHVVTEFTRYEGFHRERFEKDKDVYDQWKNKPPQRSYSWQNAVNVPLMVEGEQTITPRLFTALFPTDAPIDIHVEGDAPENQGIRIKGIIQHYFRITDLQGDALLALTQSTLFGTGYVESGSWLVKKAWIADPASQTRRHATIEARPSSNYIDYFEMYPHPAKLRMDDALPIIRRHYVDGETLKIMMADTIFDQEKLKEALNSEPPEGIGIKFDQNKERQYEILQYWGPYDEQIHQDGEVLENKAVPHWIIIVNRKVVVRSIPNPYNHQMPPYCVLKLFEDPRPNWFGVGIGTLGQPTQDRVNKIVNQRLDNVDLVLNKQGFYNGNDVLVNVKKLMVSKPGQWHQCSDTATSARWMDTPDVTASSYKEEALAKQDFREATGALANLMPEQGSEHRTAMGIQLLQGAAGMRFRPILRKLELTFIQQTAMFYFSNLKQFMTEDQWVQITGKNGALVPVKITPEQIQAKVFFIPTGISETMSKEIQVGQLLRFKEITANDPTVNRQEVNRRIAELFGFKDIDKFLTPMQQPTAPGDLSGDEQQHIQRRLAEGATPEQIKAELLGPPPAEPPQGGMQ